MSRIVMERRCRNLNKYGFPCDGKVHTHKGKAICLRCGSIGAPHCLVPTVKPYAEPVSYVKDWPDEPRYFE